jgi:xanthine dehydrogenase accessory factor
MKNWLAQLQSLSNSTSSDLRENLDNSKDNNKATCVVVTVAQTLGSAPREAGTKLIVTQDKIYGTIGGGNLEFKAIELAQQALEKKGFEEGAQRVLHRFPLGPSLGQCCGGLVILHLEYIETPQPEWLDQWNNMADHPCVLVSSLNETTGAENNDRLIVSANEIVGGFTDKVLQQTAIEKARAQLERNEQKQTAWLMPVDESDVSSKGPSSKNRSLLFFESVPLNDFHIVLFGAGHVGKAIVATMSDLDCQITWVDSREEQFPDNLPLNVEKKLVASPVDVIDTAPADSYFLVMTHSHDLDLDLSERILLRDDFRYFGLIGSKSKRSRFEKRLRQRSITKAQLPSMTCPIGISGIKDKHPAAIAIAVVAELLQEKEQAVNQIVPDRRQAL